MKRSDLTEKILDIKREKGWTWKHITTEIGGMSEVLVVGALLGQMKLTKPLCEKAAEMFGLSASEKSLLNEVPMRGMRCRRPTPLIYRFYELVMINGPGLESLDRGGVRRRASCRAIDLDMTMERLPTPKGDRVKIGMSGKFLPYKYYGATRQPPDLGYKEE